MPPPTIKRFNENLTLGTIDQVAIVYFPAKVPSFAEMTAMQAHLFQAALHCPDGFGMLLVVPESGGPPEGPARELAAEMFKSLRGRVKVVAGVLEGAGFAAAAKRSVLTVLVNVAIGAAAVKVFSTVPAGCEWVAQQAKSARVASPASLDLQATIELMRAP